MANTFKNKVLNITDVNEQEIYKNLTVTTIINTLTITNTGNLVNDTDNLIDGNESPRDAILTLYVKDAASKFYLLDRFPLMGSFAYGHTYSIDKPIVITATQSLWFSFNYLDPGYNTDSDLDYVLLSEPELKSVSITMSFIEIS
jgi:hypothetical protein